MGHQHGPVGHAGGRHRRPLVLSWALTTGFFVVELTVGLLSGSLALLSDAGHMAADVIALSAALGAVTYASRAVDPHRKSFGNYRIEVLAAGLSCLVMVGVGLATLVAALGRIGEAVDVHPLPLLLVGSVGLAVNLIALLALRQGARESLNVRGAYLEVLADAAGSVGVLVAAVLIELTGSSAWDTAVAAAIAGFVLVRAASLGRSVWAVLGQHVPGHVDTPSLVRDLRALPGVADVHDLHVWTLTSGMDVATVHLVAADPSVATPELLGRARDLLRDEHRLAHATVQIEARSGHDCHELRW